MFDFIEKLLAPKGITPAYLETPKAPSKRRGFFTKKCSPASRHIQDAQKRDYWKARHTPEKYNQILSQQGMSKE